MKDIKAVIQRPLKPNAAIVLAEEHRDYFAKKLQQYKERKVKVTNLVKKKIAKAQSTEGLMYEVALILINHSTFVVGQEILSQLFNSPKKVTPAELMENVTDESEIQQLRADVASYLREYEKVLHCSTDYKIQIAEALLTTGRAAYSDVLERVTTDTRDLEAGKIAEKAREAFVVALTDNAASGSREERIAKIRPYFEMEE